VKAKATMIKDLLATGPPFPTDMDVLRAELRTDHRLPERRFLLSFIPENSIGAELGVFTGLFSSLIAAQRKVARVTFVDPWWTLFGETYPDWGTYTNFGRLKTRSAYDIARRRVSASRLPHRALEVALSYEWLDAQPDESLDWVYLDSSHSYEGTRRELQLLSRKLRPAGVILGDDWQTDRMNRHHGVFIAVNEFVRGSEFELVLCGMALQWVLRRRLPDHTHLPFLREDQIHSLPGRERRG
jgi:hypothetical protein